MSEPDAPTTWVTPDTGPPTGPTAPDVTPVPTTRYKRLGLLGQGGMGEVFRVHDKVLDRVIAMKVLRPDLPDTRTFAARFAEEARVVAQLEHPGIPPVHDYGVQPDGRPWFTMMEIRGRTLRDILRLRGPDAWPLRRLIDAFHTACDAVAYAHARGVLHRDLKPGNIMIGDFGEVMVVDWGLAKVLGDAEVPLPVSVSRTDDASMHTRAGAVMGTPTYMSPEQRRGQSASATTRSDVYGLGAILHRILTGKRPAPAPEALTAVVDRSVLKAADAPEELKAVALKALSLAPTDRFPDAGALALAVGDWLEGLRRRARAVGKLQEAEALTQEPERLRARAAALRREAAALSVGVPVWAGSDIRGPIWSLEDRAEALERDAEARVQEQERVLHAALMDAPDLHEAHAALAQLYRRAHQEAEAERRHADLTRAAGLMRVHVDALPADSAERAALETYLRGDGALTLLTDPPGAEVIAYRYALRERRLVPERQGPLGATPLVDAPLAMGSYLLELRAPGHPVTRYPVHIGRGQRWAGSPGDPGGALPVPLSPPLPPDDVYIPPGWFLSGSRGEEGPPIRRLWCDPFVMRRFPVSNREYLAFLDDLVARGQQEAALGWAPRELARSVNEKGPMIYGLGEDGRFFLQPDIDGDMWYPDWPVCMIDWASAAAYARWYAEQTGLPWRLPGELEWEKAARGVDGRLLPWGDRDEGAWFNCNQAGPVPSPSPVDSFPIDESPYGVRGMAGNMRDWTADSSHDGHRLDGSRVLPPAPPAPEAVTESDRFMGRGGAWPGAPVKAHCDRGVLDRAAYRNYAVGFRLMRSL